MSCAFVPTEELCVMSAAVITPVPGQWNGRGLHACSLCTLSRQGPAGFLETVSRPRSSCGATGRTGRTGEPVEGVEVMLLLSQFCKIA